MRIKIANTVVVFPHGKSILVYNYLTKDAVSCAAENLYWLTSVSDWTLIDDVLAAHPNDNPEKIKDALQSFVEMGILITEESNEAKKEERLSKTWQLGSAAALFHFSVVDSEFVSADESLAIQKERTSLDPSPDLFVRNFKDPIYLNLNSALPDHSLMRVMKNRRSNRHVYRASIDLGQVSECLYSGLGITGFVKTETATLPLKMTPSGGARNPYEAYIWARNIEGLAEGIYHYSAFDHSLEKIETNDIRLPSVFLAGQDWADDMSAIVFLVADLKRTSWKYRDANAYRVVLIEAGHIAQNIMLTCTNYGLTACPTAALCHSEIANLLSLGDLTQTAVYALAIGKPKVSPDEYVSIEVVRNQYSS
jgi:SagB-type dehydrogenase family enzyme